MKSHIDKKIEAWLQQHEALQAPVYRLTLTHPEKKGFNIGKRRDGSEQFFSADEVADRIRLLAAKNSQGYNVYVTPINDLEHYIVLDDTTAAALDGLKAHGFKPCLVQESSPGNLQAIFRATRRKNWNKEQSVANAVVCRLNRKFGDPNFSGVIHPFRLAGFANRKDKYLKNGKYPFVRIHAAQAVTCTKMGAVIEQEREKATEKTDKAIKKLRCRQRSQHITIESTADNITEELQSDFKSLRESVMECVILERLPMDYSRVDWNVCVTLLRFEYSHDEVRAALKALSPNVYDRHKDVEDYAERTVLKSQQLLDHEAALKEAGELSEGARLSWF